MKRKGQHHLDITELLLGLGLIIIGLLIVLFVAGEKESQSEYALAQTQVDFMNLQTLRTFTQIPLDSGNTVAQEISEYGLLRLTEQQRELTTSERSTKDKLFSELEITAKKYLAPHLVGDKNAWVYLQLEKEGQWYSPDIVLYVPDLGEWIETDKPLFAGPKEPEQSDIGLVIPVQYSNPGEYKMRLFVHYYQTYEAPVRVTH